MNDTMAKAILHAISETALSARGNLENDVAPGRALAIGLIGGLAIRAVNHPEQITPEDLVWVGSWALFKNGEQVSKVHSTRDAAIIEAYEAGAVVRGAADFKSDVPTLTLADGYEIKEIP